MDRERTASSSTPAVLPAAGFVSGACLAPAPGFLSAVAAGAAAAVALAALRPRLRRTLVVPVAFLAGLGLGGAAAFDANRALLGWIAADGGAFEGHLAGEILRAPERRDDGTWSFRAAVRPAPDPAPGAPDAVVRFTVAPGIGDPSCALSFLRAGDRVRLWARVRRPDRPGNPGQPDPRVVLAARGDHATGWVKSPLLVRTAGAGRSGPRRALDAVLVWMRGRLDRALGASVEARGLAGAMVLGDREALRPELERTLRESGLAHLMAVSGLHVGIVVLILLIPGRAARRRPLLAAGFLGTAVVAFAGLTGGAAPVSRATCMVLLALGGRVAGRLGDPRNSLAVAAAGLVALHPPWAAHVGFRLSVGAVAGIATLAPLLASRPWGSRGLRVAVAISASAYVATAPVLAREFHRLSPAGLWTNPPAVLLGTLLIGSAVAAAALVDVPLLGPASGSLTIHISRLLVSLASAAASTPGGSLRVPGPGALGCALLLSSWAALAMVPRRRVSARRVAVAALLLSLAGLHLGPPPVRAREPFASVLDVGQGQSVVLWGPDATCVVVDAAGSAGGRFDLGDRLVAPLLLDGGCRRVEVLALSHAHDDHAGGAASILRDLDVGELWIPVGAVRDGGMRTPLEVAHSRGVAVRAVGRGAGALAAAWRLEALHPSPADLHLPPNDRGLALRASLLLGPRLVVAGDLEREGEKRALAAAAPFLPARALVASHHGARNSNSPGWLAALAPGVVVISAGAGNRFGHPHREALERFQAVGAAVFRTDRDGQVRLFPEGGSWRVGITVPAAGSAPE